MVQLVSILCPRGQWVRQTNKLMAIFHSRQKDRLEWTIQQNIPPGEYLVRVEHIGLHEGHVGRAQFYIECYQLKIEGNGGGSPSPAVKIPGVYSANDPGIAFNKWNNPRSYVMPGPKVWNGN